MEAQNEVINKATYANDVDKELKLSLYRGDTVVEEYTIAATDKMVLESTRLDPFLSIDSLHGVWGDEREFMWKGEQKQVFYTTWKYRTYIEDCNTSVYTFVFTQQMYDAATPIEQ